MYCQNCGFKNESDAAYCSNCGKSLKDNNTVYNGEQSSDKYSVWAIAGFVLSILNFFIGVTFIPGILGLIFSCMGNNEIKQKGLKGKGLALAGIIISIITLAGYILLFILAISLIGTIGCRLTSLL